MESKQTPGFADDTLLGRWLSSELSEAERQEVEAHPHFAEWQRIAEASGRLRMPAYAAPEAWEKLRKTRHQGKKTARSRRIRTTLAWAAMLAGLILAAYFLWPAGKESLVAEVGEQLIETLPDGSTVRLNADSELAYRFRDRTDNRELSLTGEAFFAVESGGRFVVDTDYGQVIVLGTEFNVYTRPDGFRVSCQEGRVSVTAEGIGSTVLTVGQSAYLVDSDSLLRVATSSLADPVWWTGQSHFKEAKLPEVFRAFRRQYGIQVSYDQLPNTEYTGPLIHDDARRALELICGAMGLAYDLVDEDRVRITLVGE